MREGTKIPLHTQSTLSKVSPPQKKFKYVLAAVFGAIAILSVTNMGQLLTRGFRFSVDNKMKGPDFWSKTKEVSADPEHPVIPAQLPGPFDTWAGGESKTITIVPPFRRGGTLILKLLDSHNSNPPRIDISGGEKEIVRFRVAFGRGFPDDLWKTRGLPSEYQVPIPEDGGDRRIHLTTERGSWMAIDSITLIPAPRRWEIWRNIPPKAAKAMFWIFFPAAVFSFIVAVSSPRGAVEWKLVILNGLMLALILAGGAAILTVAAVYAEIRTPPLVADSGRTFMYKGYFVRDPELGWKFVPNFRSYFKETPNGVPHPYFITNGDGFRSNAEETHFPEEGEAILLGDSFAQGAYLAQHETIGRRLSEKLGGYVFNLGVSGYSTDQEYTILRKMADRVRAKYVVLLFFSNDLPYLNRNSAWGMAKPMYDITGGKVTFSELRPAEISDRNRRTPSLEDETICCIQEKEKAGLPTRIARRTMGYFHKVSNPFELFETLKLDVAKTKGGPTIKSYEIPYVKYERPDALEVEWDLAFQFMVKMKSVSESHGMKLLVFMIPDYAQILNASGHEKFYLQKRFVELCGANRIDCFEPSQAILNTGRPQDLYFRDDGHFTPEGAQLAADLIYRGIKELR